MIVYEFKIKGKKQQAQAVDDAIRTSQFIRNKCLRFWMDNKGINKYDLSAYTAILAKEFPFANELNSTARQASAERCWSGINRFFENCKKKIAGKKGFPRFKKNQRSVEYKKSGWKLSEDRKRITFTDKKGIGSVKLIGTYDLHFYQIEQIQRVRLVKRADGYYCQFCIQVEVTQTLQPTGKAIGLDVGLNHFYTDSQGEKVDNPRFLKKSEKRLKRAQRRVSKKVKGSNNRKKAINHLGRTHLKVSRQRKDFAVKLARCVVMSNDIVAVEDLKVRNMVKNHHLAKSISDAAWSQFREWLEHFALKFGKIAIAVPTHFTSQNCSGCGSVVKKSLSIRTHVCKCGVVLDRDENAAINILIKALRLLGYISNTVGQTEIKACGETILYLNLETVLKQDCSLKQESPRL
ncbi:RNA-guided endonuclease InsQ/TnpB family protein [Argonema antarcticum]|uniref:RNA-guided endonuclease InsQ/TnpB family protein n=1 Tax=Argonema antarcticum TaxID=2942763 RepID=UPI00201333A9|nr:transposase [Argonema antarcticum]MCL1474302.1 transposase [Argonema antarcticum A004/B2]